MGFFNDIWKFEKSALGTEWGQLKKDPERAFIGAIDPASSAAWSGVTGKHYSPILNGLGGPTSNAYKEARADGIDTKAGHSMHKLAQIIAMYKAGSWAAGAMGGGSAANMNATNPALIDSAMGTPGYGASSAGPGGMGAAPPMGGQQMPQMQQQQQKQQQPDNSQRQMLTWAEMLRQQQEQQRHAMEDASLQRGNR